MDDCKERMKDDLVLIKKILNETNCLFGECYQIFFALAVVYCIKYLIYFINSIGVIYYMQSDFFNRIFVYNAPLIESILNVIFPVGTLCIILLMRRKR